MKASGTTFKPEFGFPQPGGAPEQGEKSPDQNPYDGLAGDPFPKKFVSNFFNDELDRLQLLEEMQKTFLLRTLNDGPAPGKHTIGMVKQYTDSGQLIVDENMKPLLRATSAEHIKTLQKAYNAYLPLLNERMSHMGNIGLRPVKVNGIYDESFRARIRQLQVMGDFKYKEGFIGPETLGYLDSGIRRLEDGGKVEPGKTPQEEERNTKGYAKRVLDAFEIAFNKDVVKYAKQEIEKYEHYGGDDWTNETWQEEDKSPMAQVKEVNYKGGIISNGDVNVFDGNMNIFGSIIKAQIRFKRGSKDKSNTIGSIGYIGKDLTFYSAMYTMEKIDGRIFLALSAPHDVRFNWGSRSLYLEGKAIERAMAYVSMSDEDFFKLMHIYEKEAQARVRDHFQRRKQEEKYWRARANIVYYEEIQPFRFREGKTGDSQEEMDHKLAKQDFYGEYIVSMENWLKFRPGGMGKKGKAHFDRMKKLYQQYHKVMPILD